jgi:hypothetical protein
VVWTGLVWLRIGTGGELFIFFISALVGSERPASLPGPRPGADCRSRRYWEVKNLTLPGLELRPLGYPVCSQPVYRLIVGE